ncbi:MAG: hypothetical protein ACK5FV_15800 [Bacteroidota bacterium]|jgi:cytochrome c2
MGKLILFIATSLDGYIARPDSHTPTQKMTHAGSSDSHRMNQTN